MHPDYRVAGVNDRIPEGYPGDISREWATRGENVGAWVKLSWDAPQGISRILLVDRPNSLDQVTAGAIEMSDGTRIEVTTPLPDDGARPGVHLVSGGFVRAGIMQKADDSLSAAWLPYVRVADAKAAVEKARAAGGTVLREPVSMQRLACPRHQPQQPQQSHYDETTYPATLVLVAEGSHASLCRVPEHLRLGRFR